MAADERKRRVCIKSSDKGSVDVNDCLQQPHARSLCRSGFCLQFAAISPASIAVMMLAATCSLLALLASACLLSISDAVTAGSRPHIVFMLTDDLGYNTAWRNSDHKTPFLNDLKTKSVSVERHYVFQYCSPTRGAFLTGRFPYHLSAVEHNMIPWSLPVAINESYTMIPKMLKPAGYTSHHVGKVES